MISYSQLDIWLSMMKSECSGEWQRIKEPPYVVPAGVLDGIQEIVEMARDRAKSLELSDVVRKLTEGHWDARTENSWERQNRRQWGPFDTEKSAEEAAKAEAETHNDTASYGEAVFECDYSSNELRKLAIKVLND